MATGGGFSAAAPVTSFPRARKPRVMADNPFSVSLLGGALVPAATASTPRSPAGEDVVPGGGGRGPGHGLAPRAADVVRIVDGARPARLTPAALAPARRAWHAARELAASGRVYGRSTGVGANRTDDVHDADHGLRLLRSHAGAIGPRVPAREARALLAVRAQQLLAGGAGLDPRVVVALTEALREGATPVLHTYGGVGTGDLGPLAQLGLALTGEGAWEGGTPPRPMALDSNDALALISSNALAIGRACLALEESRTLLRAANGIAALSLLGAGTRLARAARAPRAARGPYPGPLRLPLPAPDARPGLRRRRRARRGARRGAVGRRREPADQRGGRGGVPPRQLLRGAARPRARLLPPRAPARRPLRRRAPRRAVRAGLHRPAALPRRHGDRFLGRHDPGSTRRPRPAAETHALAQPASLGHAVLSRGVEEQAGFSSLSAAQSLRAGPPRCCGMVPRLAKLGRGR
ncbi:histidine ammonia-lyase [Streptomyces sp. SPB78]|nr:histidine ammonia-lyase [Streptomyces sp. SPB78]